MAADTGRREEFLTMISPWIASYTDITWSYYAIKAGGENVLFYCRAVLSDSTNPQSLTLFQHASPSVVCGNLTTPFNDSSLGVIFESASKGTAKLGKGVFRFALNEGQSESYYINKTHPYNFHTSHQRAPSLTINGGELRNYSGAFDNGMLDWEVRASDPPYDDMDELLALTGMRRDLLYVSQPVIEIIALPPLVISDVSKMAAGKAQIVVDLSAKADRSSVAISYKIVKKSGISRGRIPSANVKWREHSDGLRGVTELETGNASLLHIFVSYDGASIHHSWLRDHDKYANPILARYECFDADSNVLENLLFKPEDNSIGFEAGVALLLSMRGLSVTHHGAIKKLQNGPDLLASVPGRDVIFVVECTTDLLDRNNKLSNLVKRSRALADKLAKSDYAEVTVYPVIVSALPLEQLNAHIPSAHDNGVAVVSKERLETWYKQRANPPDGAAFCDEIVGLIPIKTFGD